MAAPVLPADPLAPLPSRYVVGVDLGTTNSALAYVDTHEEPWQIRIFGVPQLVAPAAVETRDTFPSFHYQPAAGEFRPGALQLPWSHAEPGYAVGFFARDHGGQTPGRQVASAKSWLAHKGVDRTAALLPWHAAADVERLSPVEVSARYLRHLREAWNARHPDEPLERQDFVLTLPASFDEVARQLTIEAAARAGLAKVVLIEEPQAAFYAWIYRHAGDWRQQVAPGQKILICDIGGGTTDFTLIRVRALEGGKVQFHRVAVGDHLILAGDNLDLALARRLEAKLTGGGQLDPRPWDVLVRSCRAAKETLLGRNPPETLTINLPASGARLLGGGQRVEVSRDEARALLLEGFFPLVALDDRPDTRRSGFQEFGLPYAADPAITRHLARFLTVHRHIGLDDAEPAPQAGVDPARPDIVLFNGGVFEAPQIQARLVEQLSLWFRTPAEPDWQPQVLLGDRLDLAVARGAAYYGLVRRGAGERIAAELARTYYIGVESPRDPGPPSPSDEGRPPSEAATALCLIPAKAAPGDTIDLPGRRFQLRVSEPVEFPLYSSSTRLVDAPGQLVAVDPEELSALAPIRTVLRTRKRGPADAVEVALHARLTELGTIELWCTETASERSWRLEFDVRSATQTDVAGHAGAAETQGIFEESLWPACARAIAATFGPQATAPPARLMKELHAALELDRWSWPPSLLRRIWEALLDVEPGRRKSAEHEARWLNLLGFALRPGYGLAVDDWRVAETWRQLYGKLVHAVPACRTEAWILWRRIAGGLSPGQQQALADPLLGSIRAFHKKLMGGQSKGELTLGPQESVEIWRLLGSLELLPVPVKLELGQWLVDLIPKKKLEPLRPALVWALGRVGARQTVYGPLNSVVPAEAAARWLERLLESGLDAAGDALAVMQLARRTGDRYRDLTEPPRRAALAWLASAGAAPHLVELVRSVGQLETEEQGRIVGEALPKGLRIA